MKSDLFFMLSCPRTKGCCCTRMAPHHPTPLQENPHSCTLVSKRNILLFFFHICLRKRIPPVLLLWLYRTPTNLPYSATFSGIFHAPVFLPAAFSLRSTILPCISPTTIKSRTPQTHVYHHIDAMVVKHGGMMP